MTAMLVPLRIIDENAELTREISDAVVKKVEDVFIEIDQLEERLDNCHEESVVDAFPLLRGIFEDVGGKVKDFHLKFKTKIREALPKLRSSSDGEDLLVKALDWRNQSPCNLRSLTAWIQNKESDIDVIGSLLTNLEVYDKRRLDQLLLKREVQYVLALVIKRYSHRDPYSKIIDDFHTCKEEQPGPDMKFFPLMDKIYDIKKISESFSMFVKNNERLGKTKFTVLEESLAEGDEAKWEIFLSLYGRPTTAKFLPPPNVNNIQVHCRTLL